MPANTSTSSRPPPLDPVRQALRDLVRDFGPRAAALSYLEALKWPILPPEAASSPVPASERTRLTGLQ
jgi:hypothetical protein